MSKLEVWSQARVNIPAGADFKVNNKQVKTSQLHILYQVMLTAIRGDINSGWIAVDDFIFLPDVEDCSTLPPEADPNHSSTTVSGETTHIPPSI